jgi:hypothetical protein
MSDFKRYACCAALVGFAITTGAYAQVSSINSAIIKSRVFNDIPGATGTYINSYPGSISFSEAGVSQPTGFADRDVWQFSNNGGASAYQFNANDYFNASFNITLTGGTTGLDLEAGFLFSNPGGTWGGDLQSLVTAAGVVVQFGGPSYYPFSPAAGGYPGVGGSVPNYVTGTSYNLGMIYTIDPNTGNKAFEYYVNGQYAASAPGNPYFDLGTGVSIGSPGDFLGGYLQIQNAPNNPNNAGTALFSDIRIVPFVPVPEPATFAMIGTGFLSLVLFRRRR